VSFGIDHGAVGDAEAGVAGLDRDFAYAGTGDTRTAEEGDRRRQRKRVEGIALGEGAPAISQSFDPSSNVIICSGELKCHPPSKTKHSGPMNSTDAGT
jgi:hypothetical protein